MSTLVSATRRSVAHDARAFGRAQGLDYKCLGEGARGRVEAALVHEYLVASKPATIREIAGALGFEVKPKSKPSKALLTQITETVTKNAPK